MHPWNFVVIGILVAVVAFAVLLIKNFRKGRRG